MTTTTTERRGRPPRELLLPPSRVKALVRRARAEGERTERLRQQMHAAHASRAATVLRLHEVAGMPLRRIADELGVSIGVVQKLIASARAAEETTTDD